MPTPINPALIISGPCLLKYKNKFFYSKGNIPVVPDCITFDVETAQHGVIEEREASFSFGVKCVPVGRLDALSVLWPYGIVNPGELLHAVARISSVNTSTEVATIPAANLARFRDGAPVLPATRGTLPVASGFAVSTVCYLHKLTTTTASFHPTEADALANTNALNFTGAGAGKSYVTEQEPLIIWSFDGDKYEFHNAVVVQSPDMDLSAVKTAIGEVGFECFRKFGVAATNAASFYTLTEDSAPSDVSLDPADIITESYTFAWGATAPWAAMNTPDGVRAQFPLELQEIMDDSVGVITRRILSAGAMVRARPLGITVGDLLAKLKPQDSGAGRGRRLTSSDAMNVSGTALYLRLYGPSLKTGPINFDRSQDRVGELEWTARRTYTTGVANPLYYVGASAPA